MSRVSAKSFYLYVLWSVSGKRFYIGISSDPQQRLLQHNQLTRGWTARHRPWHLVYQESCPDYASARKREIELKRQKSGAGFFRLTSLDPNQFMRR
jgi:putative endonuclease